MSYFCPTEEEIKSNMRNYFKRQREAQEQRLQRPIQTPQAPQPQPSNIAPTTQQPQSSAPAQAPQPVYQYYTPPATPTATQTSNKEFSLTRLGALLTISGGIGGYLYTHSSTFAVKLNSIFGRASEMAEIQIEPTMVFLGAVALGIVMLAVGLCQRRK